MPAGDGPARLGLIGAGLIGRRHAQLIAADPDLALAGVADPSDAGREVARQHGADHYDDFRDLIERADLDGVVVAAPNQLHMPIGLACIERGLPLLVEKPIADTFEAGAALVEAAESRGLPLLVGHHRRFHADPGVDHAAMAGGEVVGAEEEPHPAAGLVADGLLLAGVGRPGQQQPGAAARWAHHHPPLG
jgi:predicted dehydrogenase